MVKAGVYLVARLSPGFADDPVWWVPVVVLGLATMAVGGWRAMAQYDLKRLLAFGTVSQLGFLMIIGALGAVAQNDINRLLAFLLVSHIGFMPKPGPFPQTSQTAAISDTPRGRRTRSAGADPVAAFQGTRAVAVRAHGSGRRVAAAVLGETRIRLVAVSRTLDAALLARWAAAAVAALEGHRAEIDRINVFPVADRDTGTNMW